MRNMRFVLALVIIGILATCGSAFAQYAAANWPSYQHDAYNSGRSSATTVAKPVAKWEVDLSNNGAFVFDYPSIAGIVIDAAGNVYACSGGAGGNPVWVVKVNVDPVTKMGSFGWKGNIVQLGGNFFGGPSVMASGNILAGPGWASGPEVMFALNPATGNSVWNCNFSTLYDWGADNSPTIGYDGTAYVGQQYDVLDEGHISAMNATTHAAKWSYGDPAKGEVQLGQNFGDMPVKQINDGGTLKNVIFAAGAQSAFTGEYDKGIANVIALRDDGNTVTKLWGAQAAYHFGYPSLSGDGNTLYMACKDAWTALDDFFAFDANTGAKKWSLRIRGNMIHAPSIGQDGTIYTAGWTSCTGVPGPAQSNTRPGMITAIRDDGTSGTIKWQLELPDDRGSACSNIAVLNTNPAIMYVGTCYNADSARVYCIKDMGTYGKILWSWQHSTRDAAPSGLAVADDGTLYAAWGKKLIAFETGLNESAPPGIYGYVRDAGGNPVANAYVAASIPAKPLLNNSERIYTRTDATGYYQLGVDAEVTSVYPVTYNVATWAEGYLASNDSTVTLSDKNASQNVNLALTTRAGGNRALYAGVTTNCGPKPTAVVDGDLGVRWSSNSGFAGTQSDGSAGNVKIDLGYPRTITQANIYWEYAHAGGYNLQTSDDGLTWSDAYTTTSTTGGIPVDFYTTRWSRAVDVIKLSSPITARYWRVLGTAQMTNYAFMSIWEVKLIDQGYADLPPISGLAGAKTAADMTPVSIKDLRVTAAPGGGIDANTFYVESADRSAGFCAKTEDFAITKAGIGDKVDIQGYVRVEGGSRYIMTNNITVTAPTRPLDALAMNSRAASEPTAEGLFVKLTGKVGERGAGYFMIDDGGVPVKVVCGSITPPDALSYMKVRGIISKDSSGTTLLLRDAIDFLLAEETKQPLPLPGAMKYFRDFLVIGPFKDPTITLPLDKYASDPSKPTTLDRCHKCDTLLGIDFIARETNNAMTEADLEPKSGDTIGTLAWHRSNGASDMLDLNANLPGDNASKEMSVAYVVAYIWSPVLQECDMTLGGDDYFRVYVNKTNIYDCQFLQGTTYSKFGNTRNGMFFNLNPGLNTIVMKVVNATSGFGICANVIASGTWDPSTSGWGNGIPQPGLGYYPDHP